MGVDITTVGDSEPEDYRLNPTDAVRPSWNWYDEQAAIEADFDREERSREIAIWSRI